MSKNNASAKSAGAGLLVAITASMCCITPVLALISGASGIAASFSWLEPFRPFLIGLTVMVLGFAWYQKLRSERMAVECACGPGEEKQQPFIQSKMFLGLVTVFAMVMLAFPYYARLFYPEIQKPAATVNESALYEVALAVEGMTCSGCEEGIKHAALKVPGVIAAHASYAEGTATVKFDPAAASKDDIIAAINATGYKVVSANLVTAPAAPAIAVSGLQEVVLPVAGMTCNGCEEPINYAVGKLDGVIEAKASYARGQAVVKYDPAATSKEEIIKAINASGYKVKQDKPTSAGN